MKHIIFMLFSSSLLLAPFASGESSLAELQYVQEKMKESDTSLKTDKYLLLGKSAMCNTGDVEVVNASRTLYVAGRSLVEELAYHIGSEAMNRLDEVPGKMSILKEDIHGDHKGYYTNLLHWIDQLPWRPRRIKRECAVIRNQVLFKVGIIDQILHQRKWASRAPASQK